MQQSRRLGPAWGLAALLALGAALPASGDIRFGFRAGWTSGQLRAAEEESGFEVVKYSESGFSLGATASLRLTGFLALQPEFLYFQKGGGYDVGVDTGLPGITVNVFDTRRMAYLEVPLLVKLSIPLRGAVRPTILFGPSLAYNLSGALDSKVKVAVNGLNFTFVEDKDLKAELNDIELSFVFGGGVDIDLGRGTLVVDNRFYFGLKNNRFKVTVPMSNFALIGFPAGPDFAYDLDMANYVMSLSVGYLFGGRRGADK